MCEGLCAKVIAHEGAMYLGEGRTSERVDVWSPAQGWFPGASSCLPSGASGGLARCFI